MKGPAIPGQGLPARLAQGLDRAPLFFAALLFAGGALVAHFAWVRPPILLVALLAFAAVCCVAGLRALRMATLPLILFWILLGAWCAEMEPRPAPDAQLLSLSDGLMRTI